MICSKCGKEFQYVQSIERCPHCGRLIKEQIWSKHPSTVEHTSGESKCTYETVLTKHNDANKSDVYGLLSIISASLGTVFLLFLFPLSFPFNIAGAILGIVGLKIGKSKKSKIGLIFSLISLFFAVVYLCIIVMLFALGAIMYM